MLRISGEKTWDEFVKVVDAISTDSDNPFVSDSLESNVVVNKFQHSHSSNTQIKNPSSGIICYYCNKRNHTARECRQRLSDSADAAVARQNRNTNYNQRRKWLSQQQQ